MLRQFASRIRRRKLCLIADGSIVIRKAASSILREMRFQVAEAENGHDILAACRERAPDAVLLDSGIARSEGIDFLRLLADGQTGLPGKKAKIILCTAERNPAVIARAIDAGADEYLVKPFDRALLAAKFHQLGLTV